MDFISRGVLLTQKKKKNLLPQRFEEEHAWRGMHAYNEMHLVVHKILAVVDWFSELIDEV